MDPAQIQSAFANANHPGPLGRYEPHSLVMIYTSRSHPFHKNSLSKCFIPEPPFVGRGKDCRIRTRTRLLTGLIVRATDAGLLSSSILLNQFAAATAATAPTVSSVLQWVGYFYCRTAYWFAHVPGMEFIFNRSELRFTKFLRRSLSVFSLAPEVRMPISG